MLCGKQEHNEQNVWGLEDDTTHTKRIKSKRQKIIFKKKKRSAPSEVVWHVGEKKLVASLGR